MDSRRLRSLILLAGAFALLGAAKKSPTLEKNTASNLPWQRIEKILTDFEKLEKETVPVLDKLEALRPRYDGEEGLEALALDRAPLVTTIEAAGATLENLKKEFRYYQNHIGIQTATRTLPHAILTNSDKKFSPDVTRIIIDDEAFKDLKSLGSRMTRTLGDDQTAYDNLKVRLEDREEIVRLWAAAGATLSFLMIISFLGFYLNKKAQLPQTG